MDFQFHVHLTDQDYLDYNVFWQTRSPYGKKQITHFRVLFTVLDLALVFSVLWEGGFSAASFAGVIPFLILLILFHVFLTRTWAWSIKGLVRSLKKKGKIGYSPRAVVEFFEDVFVETTDDNKTEQKYSSIERISIVDNRVIYIHINTVMSYILPLSCFESEKQYQSFLRFIETKCANIDIY